MYAWVWLGNAYDDSKQLALSLAAYASAIEIDPAHPMPYHRGIALWYADRYDEAAGDFQSVTEIAPEISAAWMWLGRSLEPLAEYDQALLAFDQALTLAPNLALLNSWMNLKYSSRDIKACRSPFIL